MAEETLLVSGRRALPTESSTWNPKGFYMEPKRVLLLGQLKNPF
jgi:hypothetical protein